MGWKDQHTWELKELWSKWDRDRQSDPAQHRDYNAVRHLGLMEISVNCAINFCKELRLPRLTQPHLDKLEQTVLNGDEIEEGIDLIVAARLAHSLLGEDSYEQWITQQFEEIA